MKSTIKRPGLPGAAILAVATASYMAGAQAINFNIGEVEGQFDSALSVGASWALRTPDRNFIGAGNGGKGDTRTSDDGRLNFKRGETFSKIFKGVHDLELKYRNTGVFLRGKYWYDFELKDESRLLYDIRDDNRKRGAQSSGVELLDAFVYHNYAIGDLPGSVRVGKQVVSWGGSLFISGGINSINPLDANALRRPGSELKEGLLPVNMFYLQQTLTDSISMEAFYQLEWDQTVADNCGTFFASSDIIADGCDDRYVVSGRDMPPGESDNSGVNGNTLYMPRGGDRDARDSGQFGVALRWFVPELNNTEFGLYYLNYHSRMPVGNSVISTAANPLATPGYGAAYARYFLSYPEDIRLYGLSFATTVGTASVEGELSYRPNMPLGVDDLTYATLRLAPFVPSIIPNSGVPGDEIQGYTRVPMTQGQVSVVQTFDQVLGASRLSLIGEVAFNHLNGIGEGEWGKFRFGRASHFGPGEYYADDGTDLCRAVLSSRPEYCNDKGFFTRNSWGYRLRAGLTYSGVIGGLDISPSLAWSHDVDGYGPNFNEGAKAISIGLSAKYLNNYEASISYTDFFGGKYTTNGDRDFISASFGVTF
ncbi:hypothetical protein AU05_20855 [Ectopseudomonas composti]|uniref:DUF1302 domain-containing protein n=1 Tax=Ectopseudomonas composti TaxID=658457 RepID=A0ABN0S8T9_9GAMM|nr:hypothetical protein AU05_20855 [Pseudomonas composti]